MTFCRIFYRVPFSETDAMGIVHHSNHAKYLERGRVELLRLAGSDYLSFTKRGLHFPVLELQLRFRRPIYFDESLLIETQVSLATKTRVNFSYKIFRCDKMGQDSLSSEPFIGELLCTGETFHCCVDHQGRPIEIPADVYSKLEQLRGSERDHD